MTLELEAELYEVVLGRRRSNHDGRAIYDIVEGVKAPLQLECTCVQFFDMHRFIS